MSNFKLQLFVPVLVSMLVLGSCREDDTNNYVCVPDPALEGSTSRVTTNSDSSTYFVYTDIVINASTSEVWSVLTDWNNIGTWSSSFIGLTGDIKDKGQVVASYKVGTDTFKFPHTLHYIEGKEFGWSDPITFAPEIKDNHLFKVEAISDCQSRFIQTDDFTGENANFPLPTLAAQSEMGYNQFNVELKKEVEK
jgi:hypothetical protein